MKPKSKKKYAKPLSLYPLTPEEALSAFMKVDPKKIKRKENKPKEPEQTRKDEGKD